MIRLSKVGKVYRSGRGSVEALRDVSIHIRKGAAVALVGNSGSGKTGAVHSSRRDPWRECTARTPIVPLLEAWSRCRSGTDQLWVRTHDQFYPDSAIGVTNNREIMRAIVDRIGCTLKEFNEDGICRRDKMIVENNFPDRIRLVQYRFAELGETAPR